MTVRHIPAIDSSRSHLGVVTSEDNAMARVDAARAEITDLYSHHPCSNLVPRAASSSAYVQPISTDTRSAAHTTQLYHSTQIRYSSADRPHVKLTQFSTTDALAC